MFLWDGFGACVITNDSRHFIITNNGLIQARNELSTSYLSLYLNSVQPM